MQLEVARFLISDKGKKVIAQAQIALEQEGDSMRALLRLRKHTDRECAEGAWAIATLRIRGHVKFGAMASEMYFVEEALEQASSARAAAYHASRFAEAGITSVADLCGGIGGDALAFARAGLKVTLVESDPVRALFAAENARVNGFELLIDIHCMDAMRVSQIADSAWLDPSRRIGGHRVLSPDDYLPPLSFLKTLKERGFSHIGVKLSPALDHAIAREYGAGLEFLSDCGECKEGLLWTGFLRREEDVTAIVITQSDRNTITGKSDDFESTPYIASGRGSFLYEPDPAVIRAHLVRTLAEQIGASLIDPQIAYLTSDRLISTPFAKAYEILEWFPYHLKALKKALVDREVGRVVIKKRGFPQEPEAVRKQLKLSGPNELIVVLTRIGKHHQAILCRLASPVRDAPPGGQNELLS